MPAINDGAVNDGAINTIPTTTPNAPSSLSTTTVSGVQIDLSWTDNATDEDGFYVYRSTFSGSTTADYTQVANLTADTTTYADTGLEDDTEYFYRVSAYNSGGESSLSNEDSASTHITDARGFQDIRRYIQKQWTHVAIVDSNGSEETRISIPVDGRAEWADDHSTNPMTLAVEVEGGDLDISTPITILRLELYKNDASIDTMTQESLEQNNTLEAAHDSLRMTTDISVN